jgi:pilus assembly protein FimV
MSTSTARVCSFVLLGLLLLFPVDGLRALGLGEARVDSYLGQPLDVTIRLIEAESDAVDAMTVAPASPADHERLGLPSEALGLGLDVSIDRSSEPPTIRVRSQRPATDPIVQILLDARFASGRVLREYTLFLDPPTVEAPPPVRRPSPEVTEAEPEPTPAEPAPREPRPSPRPAEPADPEPAVERPRVADGSVTVSRGDTLWGIGFDWRPDPGMSMDQVMLAIFERNRHAFMGENINRLRSGAELTMPSADEVRRVGRGEAEQRIREHMQAWQRAEPTRDVPVVADAGVPEADPVEPAPAEQAEPEEEVVHRLDVVPPEDDEFVDGPAVSEGEIRRVRGALAEVEDDITAEQLESAEFDDHIAEIRDALDSRDMAGLAFAEESLAELESRLREARRERAEAERIAAVENGDVDDYFDGLQRELIGEPDQDRPVPDDDEAIAAIVDGGDPGEELAQTDPAADPAEESPAAEVTEQPVAVADEPTGLALWQWLALAVAIIVVLLVLVGVVLFLRGRSAAGEPSAPSIGDGEAEARKRVARKPQDLAAHLALLKVLAHRDDNDRFADALDQMYQHVDDESDERWQEALNLAMIHAPDHPMLTPNETVVHETGADDDLQRRTDEMLSMFDMDDEEDDGRTMSEPVEDELDSLSMEDDETLPDAELPRAGTSETSEGEVLGEDLDLADISNRLDEPASVSDPDDIFADDDEDAEIGSYGDEGDETPAESVEGDREADASPADDEPSLNLDFEPGTHQVEESAAEPEAPHVAEDDVTGLDFELDSETDAPDAEPEAEEPVSGPETDEFTLDFDSGDGLDELSFEDEADQAGAGAEDSERPDEGLSLELEDDSADDLESALQEFGEDESVGDDGSEPVLESDAADEPEPFDLDEAPELAADDEFSLDSEADEPHTGAEPEPEPVESESGDELSDEDADVKLDLARAYISVDLADSARTILEEVVAGGSPDKQAEARKLLDDL